MKKIYLPAILAGIAAITVGQLRPARAQLLAGNQPAHPFFLSGPIYQFVDDDGPQDAPVIVDGGEDLQMQEGQPIQPIVQQLLSTVGNSPKKREAAEQKLVNLGPDAVSFLKTQINATKGMAREALVVAIFRIENAPLSPKDAIGDWVAKKADADPSTIILRFIAADDLRKIFPNHLFYTAENKADGSGKGVFPHTVVALAADGKVQSINDDAALAKFLNFELPEKTGKLEARRGAAAAAILALARDVPIPSDIVSDGQPTAGAITGTAQTSGAKARKVSVAVTFSADGRVSSLVTTADAAPAKPATGSTTPPTPSATPPGDGPATMPAAPPPEVRMRMHPPVHMLPPVEEKD